MSSPIPSLLSDLASGLEEVEELAIASLHSLHLPLLPSLLSKEEILRVLETHRQVSDGPEERMALLLLLTDLVTAAVLHPGLLDLFPANCSSKERTKLFSRLGTEWTVLLRHVWHTPSRHQVSHKAMSALHSALGRCQTLLESCSPSLAWLLLGRESNYCFLSYDLPPLSTRIDGIEKYLLPISTKSSVTTHIAAGEQLRNNDWYKDQVKTAGSTELAHTAKPLTTFKNIFTDIDKIGSSDHYPNLSSVSTSIEDFETTFKTFAKPAKPPGDDFVSDSDDLSLTAKIRFRSPKKFFGEAPDHFKPQSKSVMNRLTTEETSPETDPLENFLKSDFAPKFHHASSSSSNLLISNSDKSDKENRGSRTSSLSGQPRLQKSKDRTSSIARILQIASGNTWPHSTSYTRLERTCGDRVV